MNIQLTFYNVKIKRQNRLASKARIRKSFELIVKTTSEEFLRAYQRQISGRLNLRLALSVTPCLEITPNHPLALAATKE
jgi:hypothetical protein